MFSKILIANRGEIVLRVARTAQQLGVNTVAVYSTADRKAMHVEACDEAYCIGTAAASESYLNAERILQVALESGAEAIHPGYGFLSENANFARACAAAGIVFIGPPAAAIDAMGSKGQAKTLMEQTGVPLVPGYHGDAQQDELLAKESKRIGFPQLIKASAGGGGKGMRLVESEKAFAGALVSARREAGASFGDDRVLIERYLRQPRHVEMQIFADSHGNCVHLFERDCSIQRRHQKVLEEAPAPGLDQALRARMGEAAVNCAAAIGYIGAGTVEFLLDADGSFYFMEMNTRLQVEHPVTEMITHQDLVAWQLEVAAGKALPLQQEQISMHGHALEARIYAETPARDFMPAAGKIGFLQLPETDAEVRVDTGVRCGDEIGINYDPMIAKLIVHADNREAALARLGLALRQYQILGLNTNIGFLANVVGLTEFIAADFDTGFIETHRQRLFAADQPALTRALMMATAAMLAALDNRNTDNSSPWDARDQWRSNLVSEQRVKLQSEAGTHEISIQADEQGWRLKLGDQSCLLTGEWLDPQRMRIELDQESIEFPVLLDPDSIALCYRGQSYRFEIPPPDHGADCDAAAADHPRAPMSGAVVALPIAVGDTVAAGVTLAVIEAMKMEHAIVSQLDASVAEILVSVGDQVEEGDTLVLLEVE